MAAPLLTCEPTFFTAGDSVEFTVAPPLYPPSEGWEASYSLILADTRIELTVEDDGVSTYTVSALTNTFADITGFIEARLVGVVRGSGAYAGERHVIYDVPCGIHPNPEKSTLTSMRSDAEIELAAVKAAIQSFTAGKIASYSIGGRAVQYLTITDLYQRQAVLESRIRAEQGRGFRRRLVSFVNA